MQDTIFALSSGQPPAAIGIIRISGNGARGALVALTRAPPPAPRRAAVALLQRPADGIALDRALVLWMPGPNTVTGEDMVELHCHGGRAVLTAVQSALADMPGLKAAEAGAFTRRAFENGRMDLNAVEGLSDLLAAETEQQRRAALSMAEGHFSRAIDDWRTELLRLSAMVEAALDFSDEDDVPDADIDRRIGAGIATLANRLSHVLAAPSAERLREGVRVVLAGPPNSGKSTLLNALVGRDAAIVSDVAGTTRDRIEIPAAIGGTPYLFTDTAGLRDGSEDAIEIIGMDRARAAMEAADIVLWLGAPDACPRKEALRISAQCDRAGWTPMVDADISLSAVTGEGMEALYGVLENRARMLLPREDDYALHARQRSGIGDVVAHLKVAAGCQDMLLVAEELRAARDAIDRLTGRAGTEDMLDALFSGFCIGK